MRPGLLLLTLPLLVLLACQKATEPTPAAGPAGADATVGAALPGASRDLAARFPPGRNCTVEAVQAAVRPHNESVKACYRAGLQRNPDLGGQLKVQLVVSEVGRAHAVKILEDKVGDPQVAACVRGVLETVAYAPSPAGRPCTIVYPFDFQAAPAVREQLRGGQP